MNNTPTIADVLHEAADNYLRSYGGTYGSIYSCCAIDYAYHAMITAKGLSVWFTLKDIIKGLRNMGVKTYSLKEFQKYERASYSDDDCNMYWATKQSQEMRYAWLKFAAMMAEEQGV